MALMISVSGIRGIFGSDLTPVNLAEFTAAYASLIGSGTIIVGRDSRVTGTLCEQIITATLQASGLDVITLGIVPTPTVEMSVLEYKASGGIIISASHNPAEWNALKLLNEKGEFLDADLGVELINIFNLKDYSFTSYDKIGNIKQDDLAISKHITAIQNLPYIDKPLIASKSFTIAVDAVNGAGSESVPALLDSLGIKTIHKLHCTPNGLFPHNPEPLPEHLTEISELIKNKGADLGVVVDPDVDRLAFVDENGNLFGEEYTLAAVVDFYLNHKKGDTAVNLSSSMINDEIAKKYGVTCHRSAVGEINVVKKMQEMGAVIGGEGNGGVINPDLHYGRDALVGIAMMLQFMSKTGKTASQIRGSYKNFAISKNKALLNESINADNLLQRITKQFEHLSPITIDGVKINYETSWVHMRKSNTEPIIRIYAEAETREKAEELAQSFINEIEN